MQHDDDWYTPYEDEPDPWVEVALIVLAMAVAAAMLAGLI